jgi:hypothetical protein
MTTIINRGSIWPNDKQPRKENSPEFTGTLNVEGKVYSVSAWRKKPDASPRAPSLTFSIKPKEEATSAKSDLDF